MEYPSSTGPSTRGRCMRWSVWRSATSPSARERRNLVSSAFRPLLGAERPRGRARPSTCSRSSRRSSAQRPHSVLAPSRSPAGSTSSGTSKSSTALAVVDHRRAHGASSSRRSPASSAASSGSSTRTWCLAVLLLCSSCSWSGRPSSSWTPSSRRSAATSRAPRRWLPDGCLRRQRVAQPAGRSSTGPGGSRGRPSSARSSPASPRGGRSGSSSSTCSWSRAGSRFVWFSILGGAAIHLQLSGAANMTDAVAKPGGRAVHAARGVPDRARLRRSW